MKLKRLFVASKSREFEFPFRKCVVNFAAVDWRNLSLRYRLLLDPRGIATAYANMNMRLYLCMQTRPANRNQIAEGLILTYLELLVTFMAMAANATFKFVLLRIMHNWLIAAAYRSLHKRMQKCSRFLLCHYCISSLNVA